MIIRKACLKDKEELRQVWKHIFNDDDKFLDWFFNERFQPELCTLVEQDDRIVSCLHSVISKVRVRNMLIPCILISGVSTLDEYRGQGLMRKSFSYHLKRMYEKGILISTLKAVDPKIYYSLEHFPVSEYYDLKCNTTNGNCLVSGDFHCVKEELFECYLKFSDRYSGIVLRSFEDYSVKLKEYDSCGAKYILSYENDKPDGYCIYFEEDKKIDAVECVALNNKTYESLINSMMTLKAEDKSIRLPLDFSITDKMECDVKIGASAYVIDLPTILGQIGLSGYSLKISDNLLEINNGVFDLSGKKTQRLSDLQISAGALSQWIFGYRSISDLIKQNMAEITGDDSIVDYMDSIGCAVCFNLDDY